MDVQRKKGVLDVMVLSLLISGPSYGYKIIQEVSKIMEVSESTMYPIFKRLEHNGCITVYMEEHNGRKRKYFSVTETGIEKVSIFLEEWEEMKAIYEFVEANGRNKR